MIYVCIGSLFLMSLIISDQLKKTITDLEINISYFSFNKLGYIIKGCQGHKDVLSISYTKDVVYKI